MIVNLEGNTQAKVAAATVGAIVVAIGRTTAASIEVPAPSPIDSTRATSLNAITIAPQIGDPLRHIAAHIVQTNFVRFL